MTCAIVVDRTRPAASLKEIEARARSDFEERGLGTLFLAMGLASWKADDGGRDGSAPVVLIAATGLLRTMTVELTVNPRSDRTAVSVTTVAKERRLNPSLTCWRGRPPDERLAAVEFMRRQLIGRFLQGVLR